MNLEKTEKSKLGLVSSVAMLIGGMVGSAIYSLSGLTIYYAGPAAMLSWIIAAFILLMYGMQIAELSTIFPKSGGVFIFPAKSLGKNETEGNFFGWLSTWGYINANIGGIAFAAIYVAKYLGAGFPQFASLQVPLAIAACVFCGLLNLMRISFTGKVNTVLVFALIVTMIIFIIAALSSGKFDINLLSPFFTQGVKGSTGFLSTVPNAMVAYGSIVAIAFLVSDVKNPNKNVPKSMIISMVIIVILYTLIIFTTLGLVTAGFLKDNPGMRFIPLYAAAFTKLESLTWLPKLISVSAVLALLTTMLVVIALTSRAIFASSQSKMIPSMFSKIGRKSASPFIATLIVVVLSIIVSSKPHLTEIIVNFASLFAAITICINCVSIIAARRKNKYVEGNYRAPFGIFLPIATLALIIISYAPIALKGGAYLILYTIGWYLFGIVIYVIYKTAKRFFGRQG